jgi:hypothetical protein
MEEMSILVWLNVQYANKALLRDRIYFPENTTTTGVSYIISEQF